VLIFLGNGTFLALRKQGSDPLDDLMQNFYSGRTAWPAGRRLAAYVYPIG
jgi:hypothetical protein